MGEFKITERMEPVTSVRASTTLADALKLAHRVNGVFAVVDHGGQPHALLRDEYLSIMLSGGRSRTLGELLGRFPALLTVDVDLEKLSIKDLTDFSQLLAATKAPGVAVLENNKAIGVLTRGAIAHALPLSALTQVGKARVVTAENLVLKGCMYICLKCPKPHPRRLPRQCDVAPVCPRILTHGPMQLM
jgi:CBS domain-containing protein